MMPPHFPMSLVGHKVAGYTIDAFLDSDSDSDWFEGHADNADRAIVYVYSNRKNRDAARRRIHGFKTSIDASPLEERGAMLFINLGEHRLMMRKELRELLTSNSTRPDLIAGYRTERVLGHGFKGVTYEVHRDAGIGTPYALKLTIAEEYDQRTFLPEVDRMVEIARRDRDHFPQIHECGIYDFTHSDKKYRLIYFVEDFISGRTVEKLLNQAPQEFNALFLADFVRESLSAIATLQSCNLMHDDLHAGNVMLHEPPSGRRRPYLIDFGSTKALGTTKKQRDDIRNIATQIASISNAIQSHHRARTAQEERILTAVESLLASISDDDPLRRPNSAQSILEQFDSSFTHGSMKQELVHPFDFGNAEEVMDNTLLYSLAAKSFPWRDQIEASSHLLVIGPRGCGKTTVFRSMSFKCLADAGHISDAFARPYLALYISCNKEFRQRFSAIDPTILNDRQDDVRHYFNLLVLREVATALAACADADRLIDADIAALNSFLAGHFSAIVTPSAIASPADFEARITRSIHEARMSIWNGAPLHERTTQGFVTDLAAFISSELEPFKGKTLYLLVDDYTEGKVPKEAQRALNHILFVPNSAYKCKISSEVFGVTLDETFGNFLSQDRDYREWNLGTLYCLKLPSKEQKAFLGEIVNKRLELCDYIGRVETVIGRSSYQEGTLARTLKREAECRRESRNAAKQKPALIVEKEVDRNIEERGVAAYYHGWDTICELCTGDVSNILELLNRMYDDCAVKRDTNQLIPPDHQDAVVEGYARQYISKIKGIPGYGERMFSIVNAFGSMSRKLLEEYPWVPHGEAREEPYQLLRIEVDEAFRNSLEGRGPDDVHNVPANANAFELWKLLQRYCIFIDAEESRSRRNTLSSRVILRRIFCPAFRIGLVNSECWTLSSQQWEAFCSSPSERADHYARANIDAALRRRGDTSGAGDAQRMFHFHDLDGGKP